MEALPLIFLYTAIATAIWLVVALPVVAALKMKLGDAAAYASVYGVALGPPAIALFLTYRMTPHASARETFWVGGLGMLFATVVLFLLVNGLVLLGKTLDRDFPEA